ncbi:MAG: hypothetical protein ACT4PK_10345 [Gammaproteobacteria bacterium]
MPAKGYRTVPDTELPKHAPTGITFPATAGSMPRTYVHEKVGEPKSVKVGYGDGAWLEVTPSRGGAGARLTALKKELLVRHTDTVVTQPARLDRALFRGWKTAVLQHREAEPGSRPDARERGPLRRDFLATRRCGAYMLSVRAWAVDSVETESLQRLGEAMRVIFPDPGAAPGHGFACGDA